VMTWHIELGYNAQRGRGDEEWAALVAIARAICDAPDRIEREAVRIDAGGCEDEDCNIRKFTRYYALPFGASGHPVEVRDHVDGRQIIQWGSTACDNKYTVRRAFIRLLMEDAHRKRIEVSLIVA